VNFADFAKLRTYKKKKTHFFISKN